jgi:protoheme IX farnesyltransferase
MLRELSLVAQNYLTLCKPKVVLLMLVTTWVGMQLAPGARSWIIVWWTTVGVACAGGAAAAINHVLDRHIDRHMRRTHRRPVVLGNITPRQALIFSAVLASIGLGLLSFFVNKLTACLTAFTVLGYAVLYTVYLKRATPQNIVIGGAAGAMPPLLGWTAVTGHVDPNAWLLVLIIFTWTPPHFWSLAIAKRTEYQNAGIPMLPVTHGVRFTQLCILLYTILLLLVSLLPFLTGLCSLRYVIAALLLGLAFIIQALRLFFDASVKMAFQTFQFSIVYLLLLFMVMLLD